MEKFFIFIEKHAKAVIAVVILITLILGAFALRLNLNADYEMFMPWGEGEDTYFVGPDMPVPLRSTITKSDLLNSNKVTDQLIEHYNSEDYSRVVFQKGSGEGGGSVEYVPFENTSEDPEEWITDYIIMFEAENLYSADNLNAIKMCIEELEAQPDISVSSSVLDFVTFEKRGTRLAVVPMSPNGDGEAWTEEDAATLESRIKIDPIIKYYLTGGDGNSIMFQFQAMPMSSEREAELSALLDPIRERDIDVYINGGAVITVKVMEYLIKDLITLVGLCMLMIVVVYYFSFRSKRSVLIPMSLSVIGLIWTFGMMALLGLDLTILNIVTPCMVLTLGSAYSIHVLSEYYASYQRGNVKSPARAITRIVKTIVFACMTTVCGFLCLCISETGGLVEFGIAVSIGIALCAILSCIYLPAILTLVKKPKETQVRGYKNGFMAKLVSFISEFVVKYWILLVILFFVLAGGFIFVKDKIPIDSDYMSYFPKNDLFGIESRYFAETIGGTTPFTITIEAPEGEDGYYLQKENLEKVWEYEEALKRSPDVHQVISFPAYVSFANEIMNGESGIPETQGLVTMLSRLVQIVQRQTGVSLSSIMSEDGNTVSLICQSWDSMDNCLPTVSSIKRFYALALDNIDIFPEGTKITITGNPVVSLKFSNRLFDDQSKSTILSLLVVLLICTISFRSLTKGLMTLVPVVSGVMFNYVFMYIAGIPFDLITVTFTSIAIGCGVDDAIHFMLRFRNNYSLMEDEYSYKDIIRRTIIETGRPIILSTVSIVAGMMMLAFASFTPIKYFGLLMSVSLTGCMISTLIFMPPMMILYNKIKRAIFRKKA